MDRKSVREFARAQDRLIKKIDTYKPGGTGLEHLPPEKRFNGLWDRFDDLAPELPGYDGLNRSRMSIRDKDGIKVEITRGHRSESIRTHHPRIREITIVWSSESGVLAAKTLADDHLRGNHNEWVQNDLGILEETEGVIREMLSEHQELQEHLRQHPISDGHP